MRSKGDTVQVMKKPATNALQNEVKTSLRLHPAMINKTFSQAYPWLVGIPTGSAVVGQ